jgi:tetratricopeptide (TPR) repeat protein
MIPRNESSRTGPVSRVTGNRNPRCVIRSFCGVMSMLAVSAASIHGQTLKMPSEARRAMETMYAGNPDEAIAVLRNLEQSQPQHPLAFLLEVEAQWWKIYCVELEVKYGVVDAWKRGKKQEDENYLELVDKAIDLAQRQVANSDTAEMHLYAGMGWALKARMHGLRGENRAVAHAGVAARSEFLRAVELDPEMIDATAGIGLYNYYVDSLPGAVKFLRVFMGIPGGNKAEGIQQMQAGIDHGVLTPVEMRFYLAKNLRNYDQQYEHAIAVAEPLVTQYPDNPIFQLLLGDLNAKMGRMEKAAEYLRAAARTITHDCSNCSACPNCSSCANHTRELANSLLASIR